MKNKTAFSKYAWLQWYKSASRKELDKELAKLKRQNEECDRLIAENNLKQNKGGKK